MSGAIISHREWEAIKPSEFDTDKISIRKLAVSINAGYNIFGSPKIQPVEISIIICLARRLSLAAATDSIDQNTIHYGKLCKNVMQKVTKRGDQGWISPDDLVHFVAHAALETAADLSIVATIEVETCFPKACNFGDGLSLFLSHSPMRHQSSVVLHFNRIRVPMLVGVNAPERTMKQEVFVSVWIDRVKSYISECCYEISPLVYKTVEESSFGTLESLAEELAARLIKYFILPRQHSEPGPAGVRVRIEKPSAVVSAEAPAIEIYRSADPKDPFAKRMINELGSKRPQIPFPLLSRLDDFLSSWKQD